MGIMTDIKTNKYQYKHVFLAIDILSLCVIILWISHAWYYPSLNTADEVPGVYIFTILANGVMLYASIKLFFSDVYSLNLRRKMFIIFLCIASLSIFSTYSISNTFGMIRAETLFFFTCLFASVRFSPRTLLLTIVEIFGILMVLSVVAATISDVGQMQGFDVGRWRGVFGHKNSLGEYANVTLIMIFCMWRCRLGTNWRHLIYLIAALICFVKSGSATAVAAFITGILMFLSVRFLSRTRLAGALKTTYFILFASLLFVAAYSSLSFGAELLGRDLSFTGRTEIWRWFLFFADQRPWTGWGWATIATNEGMLGYIRQTLGLPDIQTPHSGYVSIIVELGYPALVAYLLWMAASLLTFVREGLIDRNDVSLIALSLFAAFIVHNFFESTAAIIPSIWIFVFLVIPNGRASHMEKLPRQSKNNLPD
jgi:O-antigen ligase